MGYYRAGFTEIVGVDIEPQKRYPFEFVQGDALEYALEYGHLFDVIHASPPCQGHSVMTKGRWQDRLDDHINLIPDTRHVLQFLNKPYIIENVPGAKDELLNPLMLCGTMFNLRARNGAQLWRHRLFECDPIVWFPPFQCCHEKQPAIGVYGSTGGKSSRDGVSFYGIVDRKIAMGIDWMIGKELSQAIPPAYTEWLGKQILELVETN